MNRIAKRLFGMVLVVMLAAGVGCDDEPDTEAEQQTEQADDQADQQDEEADQQDEDADDQAQQQDEQADQQDEEADDQDDQADDQDDGEEAQGDDEEAAADYEDAVDLEDLDELSADDFEHLPVRATGPVAVVDGEEISAVEFNVVAEQQLAGVTPEMLQGQTAQLKQMLIEGAVAGFLIEREIEEQDIQVAEEDIDQAIKEFEQLMEMQAGDQLGEMQALMDQQGIDDAMLREQAEQQLAAEQLVTGGEEITVTEEEMRQFYQQQQAQMQMDEPMVRARHILLHVDDHDEEGESNEDEVRQQASELAEQVGDSEEKFAQLAQEHSDCPTAGEGGDLGYFTQDQLMPEFTEAAFNMSPGQISEPVRSNLGWHVIRMEDKREEGGPSFEEVRDELEMALQAQKLQQAAAELVQRLQSEASVETKEENVVVDG